MVGRGHDRSEESAFEGESRLRHGWPERRLGDEGASPPRTFAPVSAPRITSVARPVKTYWRMYALSTFSLVLVLAAPNQVGYEAEERGVQILAGIGLLVVGLFIFHAVGRWLEDHHPRPELVEPGSLTAAYPSAVLHPPAVACRRPNDDPRRSIPPDSRRIDAAAVVEPAPVARRGNSARPSLELVRSVERRRELVSER